jgi:hypothetical protein
VDTTPGSAPVSYALFPNTLAAEKIDRTDVPWSELVARIRDARTYPDKAHCPLIKLAEFGNIITDKGSLRSDQNVKRVYGVEIDYDGEQVSLEAGARLLREARLQAVLYTSPRHTPRAPRWRALLPLAEPAAPDKRAEYVARVNRALGGIVSRESFTLSQSFFIGRVQGAEYEVIETEGRMVDLAVDLEPLYYAGQSGNGNSPRDPTTDAELRAAFGRGEDRYHAMLKLSSRWAAKGMAADDIEAALLEMLGNSPRNADGVDLSKRARALAQSAVRKYGESRRARPDWRTKLAPSGAGYLGDERNILIALRTAPELTDLTRFNEFSLKAECTRSPPWRAAECGDVWTEADDTQLAAWLQTNSIKVRGTTAVADCIAVAARERPFHPVREFLDALKWDSEPRLRIWLCEYLNASGSPQYLAAIGVRFMVSAVARIMRPGCQADHSLVLEGAQGIGKTSAARALAVRSDWFAGSLPDIHSKDAALQLCGRWIIEIAELKAIHNSQIEATKTFLTQCIDTFRPPYGRRTAQFPRQCVFIGTTNETEYLRDRTGNRRYWPVRCGQIDIDALIRDRNQLWAEAVEELRRGTEWHLTREETALAQQQQQERVHVSELEQDVRTYLDTLPGDEVAVRDVLTHGLRLDPDKPTYTEAARKLGPAVAEALERCGWDKDGRRGQGKRTVYVRRHGQG